MTEQQIRAAIAWIGAVMRGLVYEDDGTTLRSDMSDEDSTRFAEGDAEVARLNGLLERMRRLDDLPDANLAPGDNPGGGGFNLNRNQDPYDLSSVSMTDGRSQLRGRARTAIEQTPGLEDSHRAAALALLERHETPQGHLSRHMLATGSDAYRSGWQKQVAGAPGLMNEAERAAIEAARAMSLTDAAGGFAVPFTLDPTIISTRNTSTNPFRRISTVRTTVTDQWQGVTSAGMVVSWDGEGQEVSDDSPTLAAAPIPVHKAQGFAIGSIEISQDWSTIEADLRAMFEEGKDDAEALVFTTGTGSNQPTGIVTALDDTASEIDPAVAETFSLADVYALVSALPAKYRTATMDGNFQSNRATWLGDLPTINKIRQFDTNGGAALWAHLGDGTPEKLLGYPVAEATAMRSHSDINPAATAENPILVFGDFRNYVIVDRVGMSVEFIPHLFGANGRPTGQRGWYCFWRVGADSVNDAAFRMLDVDTAA